MLVIFDNKINTNIKLHVNCGYPLNMLTQYSGPHSLYVCQFAKGFGPINYPLGQTDDLTMYASLYTGSLKLWDWVLVERGGEYINKIKSRAPDYRHTDKILGPVMTTLYSKSKQESSDRQTH